MTTKPKPTNDDPLCECADCRAQHPESELADIKDYYERVAVGEIVPAGECPDCGALCHAVDESLHETEPGPDTYEGEDEDDATETTGELVTHCARVVAFFNDNEFFPHEHGNKNVGEAWGAADAALKIARAGSESKLRWLAVTHKDYEVPAVWICDTFEEARTTIQDAIGNTQCEGGDSEQEEIDEAEDRRVSDFISAQTGEFTVFYEGFHYSVARALDTRNC